MKTLLISLIKDAVISGLIVAPPRSHSSDKVGLGLYVVSAIFMAACVIFFTYGCFLWLQELYTPLSAAWLTCLLMLVLAFLSIMIANMLIKGRRRIETYQARQHMVENVHQAFDTVGMGVTAPVRNNPKSALVAAVIAGLFARRFIR